MTLLPNSTDDSPNLLETLDQAAEVLAKFVVPIYQEHRGAPQQIGSGFFVRVGSKHILVSAAHVLDGLRDNDLFIYTAPGYTRKLSGTVLLTQTKGNRDNDRLDVGILSLTDKFNPPYQEVEKFAVDPSYLRSYSDQRQGKSYTIIGYPSSQSRVNIIKRQVLARAYAYRDQSIPEDKYSELGLNQQDHLALALDLRRGFDSKGQHRNFPKPQGMSGSPIWLLYDEVNEKSNRVFPIVAVGTKYLRNERVLVGTDISIVIDMINGAV